MANPNLNDEASLKEFYKRASFDPAYWAEWILGMRKETGCKPMSPQVREILDAVGRLFKAKWFKSQELPVPKELQDCLAQTGTSTRAGQGTGKDTAHAIVIHWLADCWPNAKVIVTAPKEDQAKTILWTEVRKWRDRLAPTGEYAYPLREVNIEVTGEKIWFKKGIGFACIKTCPKQSDPEAPATSMFGEHAPEMVVIVTEADGVEMAVLKALTSTLTDDINICMLAFNPRRNSGFAYQTHCDPNVMPQWIRLHHNAENSPLVSRESIQKKLIEGGGTRDSNYYRVFVRGEFPLAESNSVIPWEWVMAAVERELEIDDDYPEAVGIDPNGGGNDKLMVYKRRMGMTTMLKEINKTRRDDAVDEVLKELDYGREQKKYIDSNGCGHYMYVALRKEVEGMISVMSQGNAKDPSRFKNRRAEMWWNTREAFEKGLISIPNDKRLIAGLTGVKFEMDKLLVQIEAKAKVRARLGHSPDEAEALVLTFADGIEYHRFAKEKAERHKRKPAFYRRKGISFMGV